MYLSIYAILLTNVCRDIMILYHFILSFILQNCVFYTDLGQKIGKQKDVVYVSTTTGRTWKELAEFGKVVLYQVNNIAQLKHFSQSSLSFTESINSCI
jgi:hypothetical protein